MSVSSELSPLRRLGYVGLAWSLLVLATPGLVFATGSAPIATLALVPWALAASRPGRRAFWIEWLAAGAGISASCIWSTKVLWITLLVVAIVPGLYMALAGIALRRIAPRFPLWIAAPAAWCGFEMLRYVIEPPFGFGWMRLGHHASDVAWLAGSARVFGVGGISFVLAALAGGLADAVSGWFGSKGSATGGARAASGGGGAARAVFALAPALGPLALAVACGLSTSAPLTVQGPRVLLVQPAFEQQRKMRAPDPLELLEESIALTRRGLAELERRGERAPDLVAWGEAMLPFSLADDALAEEVARGARSKPWAAVEIGPRDVERFRENEEYGVRAALFGARGQERVLPPGTAFLSGTDFFATKDGVVERWNAVLVWDAAGQRVGWVSKAHLVPGGETMSGLERLEIVRSLCFELAGYVPDFASRKEPNVVELQGVGPRGRTRIGLSVCFDNAFEGPYTRPLRSEPGVDFHLVCSNEAWYEESFEYDQMLAFSRLAAIATGRSFVRATNAGVSTAFDPEGRELARLVVGGKDRMVAGTLLVDVPVPADPGHRTPFVALERAWQVGLSGLPFLLMLLARRRPVTTRA